MLKFPPKANCTHTKNFGECAFLCGIALEYWLRDKKI